MKKNFLNTKYFSVFFISFCLLFSNLSYGAPNSHVLKNKTGKSILINTDPLENAIGTRELKSITSSDFGLAGPLSFYFNHDNFLGDSYGAKYTQGFGDGFAASILGESGRDQTRYGATLGFSFSQGELFKASFERLTQLLPFSFDSGNTKKRVEQNAYGARYQHLFANGVIKGLDLGGFYAKAASRWLEPVIFDVGNFSFINYRHIVGAKTQGLDLGTDLHLGNSTAFSGHIHYDEVKYPTEISPSSENARGFGAALSFTQLLSSRVKLQANGEIRKIYDSYEAGIATLFPLSHSLGMELSVLGNSLKSHNSMPNSRGVMLRLGFNFQAIAKYELPRSIASYDIKSFTDKPAVYMERVLAISEQVTKNISSKIMSIEITPQNSVINLPPKVLLKEVGSNDNSSNTLQFQAIGHYADGTSKDITAEVKWQSSNSNVAIIDAAGLLGALDLGVTSVTATLGALVSSVSTVTVVSKQPVLKSILVTPANPEVYKGGGQQFVAIGTYSDATTQDITTQVNWSSSNTNVSINAYGLAAVSTLASTGETSNINASLGAVTSNAAVLKVAAITLESILVVPPSATLSLGEVERYTALGVYSNGEVLDITDVAIWVSMQTSIVTVGDTLPNKGVVKAVGAGGPVDIKASFSGITGSTSVTVTAAVLQNIVVTPPSTNVKKGETRQFTATAYYSDFSTQDVTTQVTWTSSNPNVPISNASGSKGLATVSSTALLGQTSNITATLGSVTSGSAVLTVGATLLSIRLEPTVWEFQGVGVVGNFNAYGTYDDGGAEVNITSLASWSSIAPAIVEVLGPGLVRSVSIGGPVTITAALDGKTGTGQVVVNPP